MNNPRIGRLIFQYILSFLLIASGLFVMGQSPPTATTGAATGVDAYEAVLNGTVNANGEDTTVTFEYGTDTNYGISVDASPGTVTGSTATAVSAFLGELSPNTTYHFRLVAVNATTTTYGSDMTFTTLPEAPGAVTNAATGIGVDTATLNGSVNARGDSTVVTFEYGPDTNYGTTVTANQSPVTGSSAVSVSTALAGLTGTIYHFRVVAVNAGGTTYGSDSTFTLTAAAPTAVTNAATAVGDITATLNGTVNANGSVTTVTFEYGLDTNYGTTVTAAQNPVTGTVDTAVSKVIDDISPNTTYHYRLVAVNAGGTTYGSNMTFTTLPSAPTAVTGMASAVGTTGATLNGTVNANDGSTTVTFEYGLNTGYGTTVTADQSPVTGSTDTAVSKAVTGLANNTIYHFRVVAVNAGGTTYGSDMTFTTGSAAPTATTNAASGIGTTSATFNGTVNANNDDTTVSFQYGTSTAYGRTVNADQGTVTGNTATAVSKTEGELIPATLYHFRVVAENSSGTTYGADMTFTTKASPTVFTTEATAAGASGATMNGTVNANGDSASVTFEFGTTTAYGSTVTADQSPVTGNTVTAVSRTLTGLTTGILYHYRAVAVNANGTTYGEDKTFFTVAPGAPTAATNAATLVVSDGATMNGTVNATNADTTVTFEYGTTTAYGSTVTADQSPVSGAVNTAVSKAVSGLSNNTTYHYRVAAVNAHGTTYGSDMTFTTGNAPAAITNAASSVGASFATLNGTVNANNISTTVTFQYGTSTSYGSTVNAVPNFLNDAVDTAVSADLTGLLPNTTYHFRVVAAGFGTTYGADMTFTTGTGPTAVTNAATTVSSTGATLNGTVNANNASTTVTFEYGFNTSYGKTATASPSPVSGSTDTAVSSILTGLVPNTTYHYRVVADNVNDTVYGADMTFTTGGSAPTAATDAATGVTTTGATLNGTVNAKGDSTTVTFEYGLTASYGLSVTAAQSPVGGNGNTAVSAVLVGLSSNTMYHYRVKAVNSNGTTYGSDVTFFTNPTGPTAMTQAASNIGNTYATLNGTVNANGNSTTVTFEFGPDTNYGRTFTAAQSPVTGTTDTAVGFNVTGLAFNTTYHYRVTAQSSSGAVYGADMTFTTSAPKPTVTTQAASGVNSNSAVLNGLVNANGNAATVTFEYGTTTGYGTTVTAAQSPVSGSTDTAVSAAISGLTPNTTYHFRAVGQNTYGTSEGSDMTFTTNATAPTVTTQAASSIDSDSAVLNGLVNANNDSTTVTFEYGTTTAYGTTVTAAQSPVTGTGNTAVSAAISSLTPNTMYHFRAVGQNSSGTATGADMTFTTGTTLATVTTQAASNIDVESATLNGLVNANNDSTTVTFEYGTTTAYGTTVTAAQSPVTGTADTAVSFDVTGLTPDTMYHFRVVGQNSAGTSNGADMTFMTLPPSTPTVTTAPVTHINFHTAKSGGNVTDEGASPVTARGVVWSTNPNPTLADDFTTNDSGPGPFNSTMNQLTESTTYYVRAYATNSYGTSYGEEFQFTTDSKKVKVKIVKPKDGDTVSDTVTIHAVAGSNNSGKQSGNLGKSNNSKIAKVEFYINGTKIAEDTTTPYKVDWDTTSYPDGSYTVKAVAYNKDNDHSEDSVMVTVNNSAPLDAAKISVNRDRLTFRAVPFGKKGWLFTMPQVLLIRDLSGQKMPWTISSDAGWLASLPKSGKGTRLAIVFAKPNGMAAGTYTASLTISDANTSDVLFTLPVELTIFESRASASPFGAVDGPTTLGTVSNNMPITGWVLDDIEVTGVKIYRTALPEEGNENVYIGDAQLLDGARPELEGIYPDFPLNYQAGWGYLLNTNSLPNQGNGTFTLIAEAVDKEGNTVTLGSKTITVNNADSKKPFGGIDTVMQEGSGLKSFGWALAPQPHMIPSDGSTITVRVNGLPVGSPVYNQYREDIAVSFPNYNNNAGAGGYFNLDTTSYGYGVHGMAWLVRDDAGNSSVTGFWYFSIDDTERPVNEIPSGMGFSSLEELEAGVPLKDENGIAAVTVGELEPVELEFGDNVSAVSGYLVTGDRLRELPVGSTLDSEAGRFSWLPGPGYLEDYLMVFVIRDMDGEYSRTLVRVTIEPKIK